MLHLCPPASPLSLLLAEYTPFLHKLLLLRDVMREELGLPGGLHEPARPEAFDDLDDSTRALWTYRLGNPPPPAAAGAAAAVASGPVVEYVTSPPLVVAASRGNVGAIHLLLLFGEGVHGRRKGNERALYAACEQGNVHCVAALLGRVPLRPPQHPSHVARKLGLLRPCWSTYGPGRTYQAGLSQGPRNVAASIAATKIRAELAAASGIATTKGPRASASVTAAKLQQAAAAEKAAALSSGGGGAGSSSSLLKGLSASLSAAAEPPLSSIEASVAQQELFENDGRYRSWCRGYHMGTYWYTYDTALAGYEALHGPVGVDNTPAGERPKTKAERYALTPPGRNSAAAAVLKGFISLHNLSRVLSARIAPGSIAVTELSRHIHAQGGIGSSQQAQLQAQMQAEGGLAISAGVLGSGISPGYVAQTLLVSRMPGSLLLPSASRMQPSGQLHPRLPSCVDYGTLAAETIAVKVRVNVGPVDGRTPLLVACER